jgi:putative transcriptional regulator
VKRLRTETLGVSQAVFARLLGVSPKLVEAWESGRNTPAGPVRRLFELIERDPRVPSPLREGHGVRGID